MAGPVDHFVTFRFRTEENGDQELAAIIGGKWTGGFTDSRKTWTGGLSVDLAYELRSWIVDRVLCYTPEMDVDQLQF